MRLWIKVLKLVTLVYLRDLHIVSKEYGKRKAIEHINDPEVRDNFVRTGRAGILHDIETRMRKQREARA